MSADVTLTVLQFRADSVEFASETTYTDAALQGSIDRAACFISGTNSDYLHDDCRLLAIEYFTAHLQVVGATIASGGNQGGLVGSSTVGSVSVTLIPPPATKQFDYWMNQTAYGQQYLALLQSKAPAGLFLGGSFQRVFR